ncbi:uncharacterized protein BO66DRAFT_474956 [Aspergillus aculeatinus CBS 121060]|uniref:Uncharacterized protein n=5 Tax=Aspergillus TaxID=5052 RepID=A0A2V5GZJ6_ASPV1|nr:hypothetical protein BO95DRAFT_514623 [Aspergillus brunneoviolaceus CBS 621.78]XP_025499374.1 hypothetical protein BO66DRAFT_474956 [Aspergillus aculeatinus CBS 121060]XP_025527024.1 hypothetical protein BO86DRAFT_389841 [Aspergillus japonicus CBS 114.51]XP_040800375.1 uncharacterized protein BO72DRAFT_497142 [Aspergillus fijiensis CBS 313.89]PYI14724.1 hypothetical protein BO99DRAFT_406428 [Aspergillus violaceofuscus CBS 115571]RAH45638.1 hypothetical protein BO95DRAFT_514623 [Aspergillus 
MRFLAVVALLASLTAARPAENGMFNIELSCVGLNDRACVANATSGMGCCVPLYCGADHRCHRP